MPIRFKCSNGHLLQVDDKYAGQRGLCPRCNERVLVPAPSAELTDDAILGLLGPPPAARADEDLPVHQDPLHAQAQPTTARSTSGVLSSPFLSHGLKICPKCKREVRASYDLCPHCRMYFTNPSEIVRRMDRACKVCGGDLPLGTDVCPKCGARSHGH